MIHYDAGTTNPALLDRLGDWRDHEAWVDFVTRYDPVIRSNIFRYRLDAQSTEEVCQRVWIDLARRMRTFRYDPGKTFRGWLRRLCQSRAIDLLRKRRRSEDHGLEDYPEAWFFEGGSQDFDAEEAAVRDRPVLLRMAEDVQDSVRRRVGERSWRLFWQIAVEGLSVREASDAVGISYYAAFAARKRVARMLREEGQRLMADRRLRGSSSYGPEID